MTPRALSLSVTFSTPVYVFCSGLCVCGLSGSFPQTGPLESVHLCHSPIFTRFMSLQSSLVLFLYLFFLFRTQSGFQVRKVPFGWVPVFALTILQVVRQRVILYFPWNAHTHLRQCRCTDNNGVAVRFPAARREQEGAYLLCEGLFSICRVKCLSQTKPGTLFD